MRYVRTSVLSSYLFSFYYSTLVLKISGKLAMFSHSYCVMTYLILVWLLTHVSCITSASCSLLFLILTSLSISLLVAFVLKARDRESRAHTLTSLTSSGKVILFIAHFASAHHPYLNLIRIHVALSRVEYSQGPSS